MTENTTLDAYEERPFTPGFYLPFTIDRLLSEAKTKASEMGRVDWKHIKLGDIESQPAPDSKIRSLVVVIEEADPHGALRVWLEDELNKEGFDVSVECYWTGKHYWTGDYGLWNNLLKWWGHKNG